jgi:hypothetical protein
MKIFIFGAGASFDSQKGHNVHDKAIPPLTSDLFDPRYSDFAKMVGISDPDMNRYRNAIAQYDTLETWLTEEWGKTKSFQQSSSKQAQLGVLGQITFYIWLVLCNVSRWAYENQFQCRETNAYEELLNKIKAKDIAFGLINFNYDLLLDYAVKDVFKFTFHGIDDYLNHNYVKPHGSINWLLNPRSSDEKIDLTHEHSMDTRVRLDTASSLIYKDEEIPMSGLLVKEPDHRDLYTIDDLLRSFDRQYFYPLLFLPLSTKSYSSISGFEDKIIAKGKSLIESATEIFLIGYRANDSIIQEMLKNVTHETKVHVVGLDSADDILERVLGYNSNLIRGNTYKNGFHHFAYNIKIE